MAKKTEPARANGIGKNGEFTFNITGSNFELLMIMERYSMMLDYITRSVEKEVLNLDGVVNYILAEYLQKQLSTLSKKHGFQNLDEFVECLSRCKDGEEVHHEITQHERDKYQQYHDDILSQIPVQERTLFD